MTGATRFTLFHLRHGHHFSVAVVAEEVKVAVSTTEHAGMNVMTEGDRADSLGCECHVTCRVA